MGYEGEALADLLDEAPLQRFGARLTRKVGEDLRTRTARLTPVARPFPHVDSDTFNARRGGRVPGTLQRSWRVGEVTVTYAGRVYTVPVYTFDAVAPDVEWPTRPHAILPRKPGGVLVFDTKDGTVFARSVWHPGTRGAYMLTTALAEVGRSWRTIAAREWDETAREWWRGGGSQ